jgi:hypothetical protein
MRKIRRGQEELVGFVMIVVLVAIVFLVFLGIFIRKGDTGQEKESVDIFQFLESAMEQTTACAIGYEPDYSDLGDLIQQCHSGRICTSGDTACDVLEVELSRVLDLGWPVGPNSYYKGYIFNATYSSEGVEEEIFGVKRGECGASVRGSEILRPGFPGTIVGSLRICF